MFPEIADYVLYCMACHRPCSFSCVVSGWQGVKERLCVFVVPCGGEKQVAQRLKYWWMMINSCGWWKSEAHLNRRCIYVLERLNPTVANWLCPLEKRFCFFANLWWNWSLIRWSCSSNCDVFTGCRFALHPHIGRLNARSLFCRSRPSGCHNKGVVASVLETMHCSQ